jgi:flagellar hook protein FlgE
LTFKCARRRPKTRSGGYACCLKGATVNITSSASLSGMNAAQTGLNARAHNIANTNTPDFRPEVVSNTEQPGGGVVAAVTQASQPGKSLEADTVGQLEDKNAFLANLRVFKTGDQMMGALLDARA